VTRDRAHTIANVIVATAGVATAYVILRTPSLRRLAFQGVRLWLGASVPVYLANETRRAWVQSRRAA
jgi:hypothetical protein